jgi:hypothetical protein
MGLLSRHQGPRAFLTAALLVCLVDGSSARAEVFAGDAAACTKRLASMENLFRQADAAPDTSSFLPVSPKFETTGMDAAVVKEPFSALIEVEPSSCRFDGRALAAGAADSRAFLVGINRELDGLRASWKALHPGQRIARQSLGLWIDRKVSAVDAWRIVEELSKANDVALLGVKPRAEGARQVSAAASKQLAAIRATTNPAEKVALISKAAAQSVAGCAGHERHFAAPAVAMSDLRRSTLAALKGCNCAGADLDLVEAIEAPELNLPTVTAKSTRPAKNSKMVVKLPRGAKAVDLLVKLPPTGTAVVRWEGAQ